MIVLVSPPDDAHTEVVAEHLEGGGHHVEVVDVASISEHSSVEIDLGPRGVDNRVRVRSTSGFERVIDLAYARSGWWRRLPAPVLARRGTLASDPSLDGAPVESTASLESMLSALDIHWTNDPHHDRSARLRPRVWSEAARAGIPLPRTVVTRDPRVAHRFSDAHLRDGIVAKPLVRVVGEWSGCRAVADDAELDQLLSAASSETVLQERIPGADIRVIVVGAELWAVEFDAEGPMWMPDDPLPLVTSTTGARPVPIDSGMADTLRDLVARLGLATAAVDLRRTTDGAIRLLDVDPAPQWIRFEQVGDWSITAAIARRLASADRASRDGSDPSGPLSGRSAARR